MKKLMTYTTWKLYAYFLWFNEFRIPFFSDWSKYCCSLCQNNPRSNQKNSKFTIRNSEFGRSFGEEHKKRVTIVEKSCVCMTVHNTPTPIDAKIQTKKPRQMAKMSRKISHSTVCMLAFSAVALATVVKT